MNLNFSYKNDARETVNQTSLKNMWHKIHVL